MKTPLSLISRTLRRPLLLTAIAIASATSTFSGAALAQTDESFVNWETPHVNPMALTPDNNTLLVVNTADAKLEVFRFINGIPALTTSIPVGLDPVSVRARSNTEAWVVNHVSDSISIVNLTSGVVTHTLQTEDEPADVIFAGDDKRAFVTASQANMVQVFDPENLLATPTNITIIGEDPRTLAVSPDGNTVYAAIFESGNASTIIRGGRDYSILPRSGFGEYRGVDDDSSPYAGQNPPPNDGNNFSPALNPTIAGDIPRVSMIVKKDTLGRWLDDNNRDWSEMINGGVTEGFDHNASGRVPGWDMPDNDVAIINANNLLVSYQSGLMNMVMGLSVNPNNGRVTVVGTEAHNEIRFEPNLRSHFITVTYADFEPGETNRILDLNTHIDSAVEFLAPAQRAQSLGDPRHISWDSTGAGFITGMGSNTLVRVNNNGVRSGNVASIKVGQGPTASIVRAGTGVIVLNRFEASLSVIDTSDNNLVETAKVSFFDPTPEAINIGRVQFYDTHETSGMGQVSCASCHVDGKQDRMVWDLGNPAGDYTYRNGIEFHPMKGPLRTTSLVGVVGSPSLHFRGDKDDIAGFNGTFTDLQGLSDARTDEQMTALETFIASMYTPPNPFRNIDNSIPTEVVIPGSELRIGDPTGVDAICNRCHVVADNGRSDVGGQVAGFNSPGQQPTIAPSLRSMYEVLGFSYELADLSTAGFGFIADGVMDAQTQNTLANDDRLAFMMAYNGDLPGDTHAGVGTQITLNGTHSSDDLLTLQAMVNLAEANAIGLVAHGLLEGQTEGDGFTYLADTSGEYQTQTASITINHSDLMGAATTANPLTFTAVPKGSETRLGIDRDNNGTYDADEAAEQVVANAAIDGQVCFFDNQDWTWESKFGADFRACIGTSQHVFGTGKGHYNTVSAISVGAGVSTIIYDEPDYSGNSLCISSDTNMNDLGTMNNVASSFKVIQGDCPESEHALTDPAIDGQVCFFDNQDWAWESQFGADFRTCIGTSQHVFGARKGHYDTVSAISVGAGVSTIIYDERNYSGNSVCISSTTDVNNLGALDNAASSFRVVAGNCQ